MKRHVACCALLSLNRAVLQNYARHVSFVSGVNELSDLAYLSVVSWAVKQCRHPVIFSAYVVSMVHVSRPATELDFFSLLL